MADDGQLLHLAVGDVADAGDRENDLREPGDGVQAGDPAEDQRGEEQLAPLLGVEAGKGIVHAQERGQKAKEADIGIAGGDGVGLLIKHGEIVKKIPEAELLDVLRTELENWEE